ncbi:DnaD domain protein [Rossellomorea marisflavi]|uniref:DnaD domain protein n=1 Tax=Rossellomorea marisflavi TaxID=189381 RepID=UPI00345761FD
MPDSFFFPVYSGLISPEHRESIGPALWEFLWLISKTTKEIVEEDETWGIVLGGKPIKICEISNDLGGSERTAKRNIARLKEFGYIETKRAPYGEIYRVRNSKKFNKKRSAKNGTSEQRDVPHLSKRSAKSVISNKDIKDIKKDDDMIREFENTFGQFPSSIFIQEMSFWIDNPKSKFIDPEAIIKEVIIRAKEQNPRNPSKYVMKIVGDLHQKELYTLEAVKNHNAEFDAKAKKRANKNAPVDMKVVMKELGIVDDEEGDS